MKLIVEGKTINLLRGRVAIRSEDSRPLSDVVWTPTQNPREKTDHHGTVLAMGPPARTRKGVEVDPGFKAGHRVVFVWTTLEKAWSQQWGADNVAFIPQENVLGVIERD